MVVWHEKFNDRPTQAIVVGLKSWKGKKKWKKESTNTHNFHMNGRIRNASCSVLVNQDLQSFPEEMYNSPLGFENRD